MLIIDDGPLNVRFLEGIFVKEGFRVLKAESGSVGRTLARTHSPDLILLDVMMPGETGFETCTALKTDPATTDIPIIFITGHGDIPMSVRAMKAGAVEFLTKPFSDQELLDAIQCAIERDRVGRERRSEFSLLRHHYSALTPREREVFPLVVSGLLNKQIAANLGTSEKTIKIHRSQVMQKMQADSFADLVRKAEKLQISSSPSPKS